MCVCAKPGFNVFVPKNGSANFVSFLSVLRHASIAYAHFVFEYCIYAVCPLRSLYHLHMCVRMCMHVRACLCVCVLLIFLCQRMRKSIHNSVYVCMLSVCEQKHIVYTYMRYHLNDDFFYRTR